MIELDPTSKNVIDLKQRISRLRQAIDEEDKRQTVREKLREEIDISLTALTYEVLMAAGCEVEHLNSQWILASNDNLGMFSRLPVVLVDVPLMTKSIVQETFNNLPKEVRQIRTFVILTTAEIIDHEARKQLVEYHSKHPAVLMTSIEAREALLQGDRECFQLFSRALRRVVDRDPFKYTTLVREKSELFGRTEQVNNFTSLITNRKTVSLYGIHKIGKSSLLLQVKQHLVAYFREITPMWLEISFSRSKILLICIVQYLRNFSERVLYPIKAQSILIIFDAL